MKNWTVDYDDEGDICHSRMVNTNEDWYPTVNGQLKLLVIRSTHSSMIRICIWGGDDFGMEKDYTLSGITFEEARWEAYAIPEPITVEWLEQNGFIVA